MGIRQISKDHVLLGSSVAYTLVLIACVGALAYIPCLANEPAGHAAPGCHLTGDQLVFGANCHAFPGAGVAEVLLSLPLALFLLPLAGLATMAEVSEAGFWGGAELARLGLGAIATFVGASFWAPPIYLFAAIRRAAWPAQPVPLVDGRFEVPTARGVQGAVAGGNAASSAVRPSSR